MALPIIAAIARGASVAAQAAGRAAASVGQGVAAAAQSAGAATSQGLAWADTALAPVAQAVGMAPTGPVQMAANAAQTGAATIGQTVAQAAPAAARAAASAPTAAAAAQPAAAAAVTPPTNSLGGSTTTIVNNGPSSGFLGQLRQQIAQALAGGGQQGNQPAIPMPPGYQPQQPPPAPTPFQGTFQQTTQNVRNAFGGGTIVNAVKQLTNTGNAQVDQIKDFALSLVELPEKLKDFGASVVEARRYLAEYNGGMANAFQRLEFERFGRNVRLAGMTSRSTAALAETQSRLEEKLLPYAAAGINLLNKILAALETGGSAAISFFEVVAPVLGGPLAAALAKWLAGDPGVGSQTLVDLSKSIADGTLFGRGRPPKP